VVPGKTQSDLSNLFRGEIGIEGAIKAGEVLEGAFGARDGELEGTLERVGHQLLVQRDVINTRHLAGEGVVGLALLLIEIEGSSEIQIARLPVAQVIQIDIESLEVCPGERTIFCS